MDSRFRLTPANALVLLATLAIGVVLGGGLDLVLDLLSSSPILHVAVWATLAILVWRIWLAVRQFRQVDDDARTAQLSREIAERVARGQKPLASDNGERVAEAEVDAETSAIPEGAEPATDAVRRAETESATTSDASPGEGETSDAERESRDE